MDKFPDYGIKLVRAASLNVRVGVLMREMRDKKDARIKEISDVQENGRKLFISKNP